MKILRLFGIALTAIFMILNINSCEKEIIEDPTILEEGKAYEVQLNLGGEYIEVSEAPLSKSEAPKKYYAIEIYCLKADGSENEYSFYAEGVFDNIDAMKLTLLGGYKYKFICTSAIEGEDKFTIIYDRLYWLCDSNIELERINKFYTDSEYLVDFLDSGHTEYSTETYQGYRSYPRMDRYYGVLEDYIPTEGGIATISMKRCVFGVNMIINGVPDGTLSWDVARRKDDENYSYDQAFFQFGAFTHTGSEKLELPAIYTFSKVGKCWEDAVDGEVYSEAFSIKFTWERSNGYKQEFSQEFTVKRNVMTNINISLTGGSSDIGLGFNEENVDMINENIDVIYNGGESNDTGVNPEN